MSNTAEQMTRPPFPEKMSFKEMFDSLFNRDFMSEEEFKTICDAAEMYANGCIKHAADLGYQLAAPVSSEEGKEKVLERIIRTYFGLNTIENNGLDIPDLAEYIAKSLPTPSTPQGEQDWVKRYSNLREHHNMIDSINTLVKDVIAWQSLSSESSGAVIELITFVKNLGYMNGTKSQGEFTPQEILAAFKQSKP